MEGEEEEEEEEGEEGDFVIMEDSSDSEDEEEEDETLVEVSRSRKVDFNCWGSSFPECRIEIYTASASVIIGWIGSGFPWWLH